MRLLHRRSAAAGAVPALLVALCLGHPTPVRSQDAPPAPPARLHVTASGEVTRAPDRATLMLGVETRGETAATAAEENAREMEAVLSALRELGVPERRVRTQRLSLRPETRRVPGEDETRVIGYHASNAVMVELDDVEAVGTVMDAAVRAGANQVMGARLTLEDSEAAYQEALAVAVDRARAKAEALAEALGAELGPMLDVVEGGARAPARGIENLPAPEPESELRMRAVGMAAPVSAGEVEVRASLQITWRLIR